jgi:hypothetical protein
MPKTATFTTITPLPSGITRKSVLDMYEDHMAMIDLNPLVVERFKCKAPSYAPSDEYFAAWYTIKGNYTCSLCYRSTTDDIMKTKSLICLVGLRQAQCPIMHASMTRPKASSHTSTRL